MQVPGIRVRLGNTYVTGHNYWRQRLPNRQNPLVVPLPLVSTESVLHLEALGRWSASSTMQGHREEDDAPVPFYQHRCW